MSARHVVVVGAGFAGLAAASRLAAAGCRVALLERASRAGGRAAADAALGRAVDPLAAGVSSADRALYALIEEGGLTADFLPLRPWRRATPSGVTGAPLVAVAEAELRDVARTPGVRRLDALRLLRFPRLLRRYAPLLDPARPEGAAPLDDRSLRDFGALYFGRSIVERWMEPWLAERAPVDEREASRAAFLLRWVAARGAQSGALREPPGLLAELVAARLGACCGRAVEAVEPAEADALGGLRVRLAGEPPIEADAVVLAVPAAEVLQIAAPLLASAERDALGALRCDAAIAWRVALRCTPVSAPTRVRLPRAAGSAFSVVALEPGTGGAGDGGQAVAIAREPWAGAQLATPDDALEKELRAALVRAIAGAEPASGAGRIHRIAAAWPRFDVGTFRTLARLRAVAADHRAAGRRLYLAGDHLLAPTLEGAVASGHRAAAEMLADLGSE